MSRLSTGRYAWNACAGSRPCVCTRSRRYGTTRAYSSTSGNAISRNWQNNANASWHPSCSDETNLRCAASAPSPPSNAMALFLRAVSTSRGTVVAPPGAPHRSASFKRAMPLARARVRGRKEAPAETASARRIGPPAIASICASERSSSASEPVARKMISFRTSRSRLWSSRNTHTRYCSIMPRSMPASPFTSRSSRSRACLRARWPQTSPAPGATARRSGHPP